MGRKPKLHPKKLTVTRYYTPDGKRCNKSTPGAAKRQERTDSYYLELPDGKGNSERIALETTDEGEAWGKIRQILEDRKLRRLGIVNEQTDHLARPFTEHLQDWVAVVLAGGATEKQVAIMQSRLEKLSDLAGWKRLADITRSNCLTALAALAKLPEKRTGGKGLSAQTRNHYLSHARQFTRWLLDEKRLLSDPLTGVSGVSVDGDRRHDRRSPGESEVRVLFDYLYGRLGKPATRCGMTGEQRALGYCVAMSTGLRAGELRSLSASSFDLDAGTVRVKGAIAKNRKRTLQPVPSWLCDSLRAWLDGGGGVWGQFPASWPGRLLQADLADARAAWIASASSEEEAKQRTASTVCVYEIPGEDGPLFWDFHALRHWYVTQIAAQSGISPSTLQALSRHSDPKLTLERYAKAQASDVRKAVDQVRPPGA